MLSLQVLLLPRLPFVDMGVQASQQPTSSAARGAGRTQRRSRRGALGSRLVKLLHIACVHMHECARWPLPSACCFACSPGQVKTATTCCATAKAQNPCTSAALHLPCCHWCIRISYRVGYVFCVIDSCLHVLLPLRACVHTVRSLRRCHLAQLVASIRAAPRPLRGAAHGFVLSWT